jgi:glycosyltransferase involved in cell wall biosynthesis
MKSKVVVVQNIITTYRIELFNELQKQLAKMQFDFEVLYYKESYPGRYLPFSKDKICFKFKVGKGFFSNFRKIKIHFNPLLIWSLTSLSRRDKIIIGVSWNDINTIFTLLLKKLGLVKAEVLLWSEANYLTKGARSRGRVKVMLRDFIFNFFDYRVIVPGEIARKTICEKWGYNKELCFLPNLINGSLYHVESRPKLGKKIKLLTIARLEEADKGIINFIRMAGSDLLSKFDWKIAGDGPDMDKLAVLISELNLNKNISLLGNKPSAEVKQLYADSNVFLLPSLSDPNPLTVIEALHAGLVVLLSTRCGNVSEAVREGGNGFSFDPVDKTSVQERLKLILDNTDNLEAMSFVSRSVAGENFDLVRNVSKFLEQLYLADSI